MMSVRVMLALVLVTVAVLLAAGCTAMQKNSVAPVSTSAKAMDVPTMISTPVKTPTIYPMVIINKTPSQEMTPPSPLTGPMRLTGTVVFNDFEGGFYGIVADNNMHYLPLHLDDEYKKNGTRVAFEGVPRPDISTISMWGNPIEITSINRL